MHRFDAGFPTTPHSDVIHHDGSVWDGEPKLFQVAKKKQHLDWRKNKDLNAQPRGLLSLSAMDTWHVNLMTCLQTQCKLM